MNRFFIITFMILKSSTNSTSTRTTAANSKQTILPMMITSSSQCWLKILAALTVVLNVTVVNSFQPTLVVTGACCRRKVSQLYDSIDEEDDEEWRKQLDGGGDLTDRFKHKVSSESYKCWVLSYGKLLFG